MAPKTRLDPLVRVRERTERSALAALADAQSGARRAAERLAELRARTRAPGPGRDAAGLWALEELAHTRELHAVHDGERDVAAALAEEQAARSGYVAARQGAEVVRKARERKRAELAAEGAKKERSEQDELAALGFQRRRG